jgi:hypothetical protein
MYHDLTAELSDLLEAILLRHARLLNPEDQAPDWQ